MECPIPEKYRTKRNAILAAFAVIVVLVIIFG